MCQKQWRVCEQCCLKRVEEEEEEEGCRCRFVWMGGAHTRTHTYQQHCPRCCQECQTFGIDLFWRVGKKPTSLCFVCMCVWQRCLLWVCLYLFSRYWEMCIPAFGLSLIVVRFVCASLCTPECSDGKKRKLLCWRFPLRHIQMSGQGGFRSIWIFSFFQFSDNLRESFTVNNHNK